MGTCEVCAVLVEAEIVASEEDWTGIVGDAVGATVGATAGAVMSHFGNKDRE